MLFSGENYNWLAMVLCLIILIGGGREFMAMDKLIGCLAWMLQVSVTRHDRLNYIGIYLNLDSLHVILFFVPPCLIGRNFFIFTQTKEQL